MSKKHITPQTTLYEAKGNKLHCLLCPNYCMITDNSYGICKTRKNKNGKIFNAYHGIISSTSVDPMEKKPLYHFMPSTPIFSVGFFGCTLQCQFCQNYSISQYHPADIRDRVEAQDIVSMLKSKNIGSIAFTYSEPTLYFEWVYETAYLCREAGIKTVLVTNGYLNPEPAKELFTVIDAANIDLKSSNDGFYKKHCKGKLNPVKTFIKEAFKAHVHIELTTLVITDTNDSQEEMENITDFIVSVSPDIPFHISRYHPVYNFTKPSTDPSVIEARIKQAKKKLTYVYGGNIAGNSDTYCRECDAELVSRNYYNVSIKNLDGNGNCKKCGTYNHFIIH